MSPDDAGSVKPDELIGKLVPDPANPDVQRLGGFALGESDRSGYFRLYLNADLTEYLEFRKDDCLHGEQFGQGTLVWLKRDAEVTYTRSQTEALRFLRGDISTGFLRATGFAAVARAAATGGTLLPTNCCFTIRRDGIGGPA